MADVKSRFILTAVDNTKGAFRSASQGLRRLNRQVKEATSGFNSFFIGAALTGASKGIISLSDEYTKLQARVRGLSDDQESFNINFAELEAISQRVGSTLAPTVNLFNRVALAGDELGATQSDILAVTEAFQQLAVIGGASAEQVANASLQFGQGLGEGVFRAQEFNSILENTPKVVDAIADGLGITRGELSRAIRSGEVLSKDVFDALLSQTQQIGQEFAQVPDTVDRAAARAANSLQKSVSLLNESLGLSNATSQALTFWSNAINEGSRALFGFNENASRSQGLIQAIGTGLGVGFGEQLAGGNTALERRIERIEELEELSRDLQNTLDGNDFFLFGDNRPPEEVEAQLDAVNNKIAVLKDSLDDLRSTPDPTAGRTIDVGFTQPRPELEAQQFEPIKFEQAAKKVSEVRRKAISEADREAQARTRSINSIIDSLKEEAATTSLSAEETVRWQLAQLGATEETIKLGAALQQSITAQEEAAEAARLAAEEQAAVVEKQKEASRVAEELGFTFASGFEDAIVQGESFRDVLDGIAEDILRITTRELATKPLASFFQQGVQGLQSGGGFGSFPFSNLLKFANGGRFTVGGSGGTDSTPVSFLATPGEEVQITKPGQRGNGGTFTVINQFPSIRNYNQFQRSERQINDNARAAFSGF